VNGVFRPGQRSQTPLPRSSLPAIRVLPRILRQASSEWIEDNAPRLGASVAFYTLLSLAPVIVLAVAAAAMVYGQEAAQGRLAAEIRGVAGPEVARTVQEFIGGAYQPGTGAIATLLGATIARLIKDRFYSFAVVLGAGFLLLVSLALNAWIETMRISVSRTATFLISYIVITVLFAALYKIVPDVRLNWSDVVPGAMITAFLFMLGKELMGLYFAHTGFVSAYSAAGSPMVVFLWIYYSAQLFFWGAEFSKVYKKTVESPGYRNR
jgi:membrane protein